MRWSELLVASPLSTAPAAWAQTAPAPDPLGPIRSMGKPPVWKPFVGGYYGLDRSDEETRSGGAAFAGVYKDLLPSIVGAARRPCALLGKAEERLAAAGYTPDEELPEDAKARAPKLHRKTQLRLDHLAREPGGARPPAPALRAVAAAGRPLDPQGDLMLAVPRRCEWHLVSQAGQARSSLWPAIRNLDRQESRQMNRSRMFLVFVLVAAAAALRATPVAAQVGPEQTTKFLKTVEGTVKAIGESRAQLEKTVATYNSITEMTAKDLKSAYKDLNKDVADSEKKVADGRPKVDEMNTAAEGYFAAWKASAAAISDPDLRKRSEERLADARARFDKIAVAGKDARQSFDTVMTDIKDQSTFLGHDLNPSAIATLKPNAAKFNARAATVFTKTDGVTKMFEEYIASMKP